LNERYESWIDKYKLGKLLIFDVDNIDVEEKPEDLAMIIEKVNAELHGLF
jgi:deoxyadenosine/deoxycytidine kinase